MSQRDTLDSAAYTCMLVSYRRLPPQFKFSLSGVTLMYLSQWFNPLDTHGQCLPWKVLPLDYVSLKRRLFFFVLRKKYWCLTAMVAVSWQKSISFLAIPPASWPKIYRSWQYLPLPGQKNIVPGNTCLFLAICIIPGTILPLSGSMYRSWHYLPFPGTTHRSWQQFL
jgi:hypothetical protein